MIRTLENAFLLVSVSPSLGRWRIESHLRNGPSINGIQIGVDYRLGVVRHHALDAWPAAGVSGPELVGSPHGFLQQLTIHIGAEKDLLHFVLRLALPRERPLLLWQLQIENRGLHPVHIDQIQMLSAGFFYPGRLGLAGKVDFAPGSKKAGAASRKSPGATLQARNMAFFSNGWQSYSYTGVLGQHERLPRTRLGPLRAPVSANPYTPHSRRRGRFASDMFGVLGDQGSRVGILAGFLSQQAHFGSVETWISATPVAMRLVAHGDGACLDPGSAMQTDWACLQVLHLDSGDPLGEYIEAVARQHALPADHLPRSQIPTGWCSWYQFSSEGDYIGDLTAQDVEVNLQAAAACRRGLPLEVVQIDDGFEAQVGDWFSFSEGFPNGVAPLATEIRAQGMAAGLWLAPFIVHPKSRLANDHPDWLMRGHSGRPVNAGYFWGAFARALDLTHPPALEYAAQVVHTAVKEWGFSYLKLDFLFAGALSGRRKDPTCTRAQVLRAALKTLRDAAGSETFILGCSCPLGPAIGLVDAMRINADTARRWLPSVKGHERFLRSEPDIPSARNASHNAITRSVFHRRWWINDPDCLLLRQETRLTLPEVRTISTVIALTGGSLLLSDHLPDLAPERLRIAQTLLPVIGQQPFVLDWFDRSTPSRLQVNLDGPAGRWHLLGLFNWQDQPQKFSLRRNDFYLEDRPDYLMREFWSGQTFRLLSGEVALEIGEIPPHGCALLAARQIRAHRPHYLGGDLHISQGMEVAAWHPAEKGLSFCLERPGSTSGLIELALPGAPVRASLNGNSLAWEESGNGIYRLAVSFEQSADLQLEWHPL